MSLWLAEFDGAAVRTTDKANRLVLVEAESFYAARAFARVYFGRHGFGAMAEDVHVRPPLEADFLERDDRTVLVRLERGSVAARRVRRGTN